MDSKPIGGPERQSRMPKLPSRKSLINKVKTLKPSNVEKAYNKKADSILEMAKNCDEILKSDTSKAVRGIAQSVVGVTSVVGGAALLAGGPVVGSALVLGGVAAVVVGAAFLPAYGSGAAAIAVGAGGILVGGLLVAGSVAGGVTGVLFGVASLGKGLNNLAVLLNQKNSTSEA